MLTNVIMFLVSLVVCFGAAAIGQLATGPAIPAWYAGLNKPFFTPPNWLFGPAWTLLYFLMAVAAFLVWQKKGLNAALGIFLLQLALNAFWSVVFFGWHSLWGALAVIVLLWLAILWTIISFMAILPLAGWLLVPYILWVSFASVLNLAVALLNR